MPDKSILLLYIGEDFLLPTVLDAEGDAYQMKEEKRRHFWLYFNANTRMPEYGYGNKLKASNREPGFYGDFLMKCASGEQVSIDNAGCDCFDLMIQSGMVDDLRNLFVKYSRNTDTLIETAFIFAESVPDEQRKAFIRDMKRCDFQPIAFSALFSEIIMDFIRVDKPGLKPVLGDKALILNSVNEKLVLTDAVFDGAGWMSDGTCQIEEDFGDSPIKDALVRYVIRSIDKSRSYLHNEERFESEFVHQRPNADRWLALPSKNGSRFIDDFCYRNSSQFFPCEVPDRVLSLETDKTLSRAMGDITDYIDRRLGKNLVLLIMTGVAFEDESLVNRITKSVGVRDYRVITTTLLPKVFSRYQAVFGGVREDFNRFNDVMDDMRKKHKGVAEWGASASDIRNLRLCIKDAADKLEGASKSDAGHYEEMIKLSDGDLAHSAFPEAGKKLEIFPVPSDPVLVAIQKANGLADNARQKQQLFERIGDIPGAKAAVSEIEKQVERINTLIQESDGRVKGLREQRNLITYYESHYDEYRRLKNEFNSKGTPAARRRALREEMIPLTREPLPELVLKHVRVQLNAEVTEVRRFLSRKKTLRVHFEVLNGDVLPCPAVLNIMEGAPIEPLPDSPTCIRIDIPKGESSFVREFDLSEEKRIVEGKTLRIRLFTDEFQLDTDAIKNETGTDNPFIRINQV